MKKIFLIITLVSFLAGCEKWLEINDPNTPEDVSVDLILPAAQASLGVTSAGSLYNISGFFVQYWSQAPEANQYNDIETYDMNTDVLDYFGVYQELFTGCLNDLERIRTDAEAADDWGNYLAATVLRAYGFQMFVDIVDKSPYSEALKGVEIVAPKWEDGQAVYNGLISEIKEAKSKITSASRVAVSTMVLSSDIDEWVGFANAMLLKLYMRQRFVNDVSTEVKALIIENEFMTQDVAFTGFENQVGKRNPWVETAKSLNTDANHIATVNIIRFYQAKTDPRMNVIFNPAAATSEYTGIYPALKEVQPGNLTRNYSRPAFYPTKPAYFITMAELYLFIAEAELIFNNDKAAAKDAYEAAIDYSLATNGLDPSAYDLYSVDTKPYYFDVTKSIDELFEQIMMQKWASLCGINHLEAWSELRRTDIPKYFGDRADFGDGLPYAPYIGQYLDPAKNDLSTGIHYPLRLPYPDVATTRNENTPKLTGTQQFENKVWWDVQLDPNW